MESTRLLLLVISLMIGSISCATYGDGTVHAEFEVRCNDYIFVVYFNKTKLEERTVGNYNTRSYSIKLGINQTDPDCIVANSTTNNGDWNLDPTKAGTNNFGSPIYIGTQFVNNMCGVQLTSDDVYIKYNATVIITYGEDTHSLISREEYDYYHVTCLRNRTVTERVVGDGSFIVNSRLSGKAFGNDSAPFSISITHTDMNNVIRPTYNVGDYIKFQMTLLSSIQSAKAVIQNCYATSDGVSNRYNLISPGCDLEERTSWVGRPARSEASFKTEAFRYAPSGNTIYVKCIIRMCLLADNSPECILCPFRNRRKRRAISSSSSPDIVVGQSSSGLVAVRTAEFYLLEKDSQKQGSNQNQQKEDQWGLSGIKGILIIVLVAVFVIVVCVAIIKKVFFGSSSSTSTGGASVVSFDNKAMA